MEGRQYLITQSNSILVVRVYARVRTPEHAIFKLYLISGSHAYRIHKWTGATYLVRHASESGPIPGRR